MINHRLAAKANCRATGDSTSGAAGSPLDAGLNAILSSDGVKQHGIGFVVWLNIRESPNE